VIPLRDSTYRASTPHVTRALIVINILLWGFTAYVLSDVPSALIWIPKSDGTAVQRYLNSEEDKAILALGAVPEFITGYLDDDTRSQDAVADQGVPLLPGFLILLTPLTAMFLHGGFFHLAGNMLFLWVFGDNVEDRLGSVRFLIFYVATGYLAAAAHIYIDSGDLLPMIGASGAISGVLGAYLLLFPRALVQVLIPLVLLIPAVVPAPLLIGIWFLLNVLPGVGSVVMESSGSGTAWWAHIGGFVAGMLLVYPFLVGRWRAPRQEIGPQWSVPTTFGFGFGARRGIPRQGRLRGDPPPQPPPALNDGVDLPANWRVTPAPAKRRRFGVRVPGRRRGTRPGGVDAFRDTKRR
jgi:membrane associated rhomboid family serine protease